MSDMHEFAERLAVFIAFGEKLTAHGLSLEEICVLGDHPEWVAGVVPVGNIPNSTTIEELFGEFHSQEGRVRGALRRAGIDTVGQLAELSAGRLWYMGGLGVKSISLIAERLAEHGIELKGYRADATDADYRLGHIR